MFNSALPGCSMATFTKDFGQLNISKASRRRKRRQSQDSSGSNKENTVVQPRKRLATRTPKKTFHNPELALGYIEYPPRTSDAMRRAKAIEISLEGPLHTKKRINQQFELSAREMIKKARAEVTETAAKIRALGDEQLARSGLSQEFLNTRVCDVLQQNGSSGSCCELLEQFNAKISGPGRLNETFTVTAVKEPANNGLNEIRAEENLITDPNVPSHSNELLPAVGTSSSLPNSRRCNNVKQAGKVGKAGELERFNKNILKPASSCATIGTLEPVPKQSIPEVTDKSDKPGGEPERQKRNALILPLKAIGSLPNGLNDFASTPTTKAERLNQWIMDNNLKAMKSKIPVSSNCSTPVSIPSGGKRSTVPLFAPAVPRGAKIPSVHVQLPKPDGQFLQVEIICHGVNSDQKIFDEFTHNVRAMVARTPARKIYTNNTTRVTRAVSKFISGPPKKRAARE